MMSAWEFETLRREGSEDVGGVEIQGLHHVC